MLKSGDKFNYFQVVGLHKRVKRPNGSTRLYWEVECICGKRCIKEDYNLKTKATSCGCQRIRPTKQTGSKEYNAWQQIRRRHSPEMITRDWDKFVNFKRDMGSRPEGDYQLKRRDPKRPYSKDNCFWGLRGKHGKRYSGAYRSWQSMKNRCNNPEKFPHYKDVTYDPEWEKFENFYRDMGDRPEGHELDKDLRGDGTCYSKDACTWLTHEDNMRIRECNVLNINLVELIRDKWESGLKYGEIAKDLCITTGLVGQVVRGDRWS